MLVTAAYNNEGGIELARFLLQTPPQYPPHSQSSQSIPWCMCLKCWPMETVEENVCCHKSPCVTYMGWFDSVVLNRDVLSLTIEAHSDLFADLPVYTPTSYRKAAYRQFVLWQYGHLGRSNHCVVPSCVVLSIRCKYPALDGHYVGFQEYRKDELAV